MVITLTDDKIIFKTDNKITDKMSKIISFGIDEYGYLLNFEKPVSGEMLATEIQKNYCKTHSKKAEYFIKLFNLLHNNAPFCLQHEGNLYFYNPNQDMLKTSQEIRDYDPSLLNKPLSIFSKDDLSQLSLAYSS